MKPVDLSLAADLGMDGRKWPHAEDPITQDVKLDILDALRGAGAHPALVEELAERADRYFATLFPATVGDWINACHRELYRANNGGDVAGLDQLWRERGLTHIGRIELTRFTD